MKGTHPRGLHYLDDEVQKNLLQRSEKNKAENLMIVDLLRNDIGKVCKGGSVTVSAHKRLEAYQNVYHLVSDVVGDVWKDVHETRRVETDMLGDVIIQRLQKKLTAS